MNEIESVGRRVLLRLERILVPAVGYWVLVAVALIVVLRLLGASSLVAVLTALILPPALAVALAIVTALAGRQKPR